jgi:hypothetical protein
MTDQVSGPALTAGSRPPSSDTGAVSRRMRFSGLWDPEANAPRNRALIRRDPGTEL